MNLYDTLFAKIPSTLSFISTYKCTASCADCCFDCSPEKTEELPINIVKQHIEYVNANCPSVKTIVITGGEAFINFSKTLDIIKEAKRYGYNCRVVTNGFWGQTIDKAVSLIQKCINAGLDEINFSTGDNHLDYIPLENVCNAIYVATKSKLLTVVNVESGEGRSFSSQVLLNRLSEYDRFDKDKLMIINGL